MKQILQSYRSGELWLAETPAPACRGRGVVVATSHSLVSAGTERMVIELAKKSLVGKARARPDLVRQVIGKIKTEGLSQTMSKVFARLDTPIPLGYSSAGIVVETPDGGGDAESGDDDAAGGAGGMRVGDRVACGGAGYATHAEYNYVPRNLCVKVPEQVSFEAASFTTLGAIAMQGVRQADPRLGETVAVIGLGLVGLLTVQLLKAAGCGVIGSDPDTQRCRLARDLGADQTAAGEGFLEAAESFSQGRGVDAVIVAASTPSNAPIETAAAIARQKGRVVVVGLVGINVPRDPFYKKELDLRLSMSYGPGRYDAQYEEAGRDYPYAYVRWTEQRNMESFLHLVSTGAVTPDKLITHRYPIDQALDGYALLEGKPTEKGHAAEKYLGIVLDYPATGPELPPAKRTVELSPVVAPRAGGGEGADRNRIGVGFLGAGNFARGVLLPALAKRSDVRRVGLCTATGASASETGRKHGFGYATTDPRRLLDDPEVQAVFIATSHDTHARFACDALEAGKHVFMEKPLCIRSADLEQYETVVSQIAEGGPCLMVGFNRRFSPHARAVRDVFDDRKTPMVVSYRVNAGVVPPDHWIQDPQVGGGRIIGEACHFVDLCAYLIGREPVRVQASSVRESDARYIDADSVVMTIEYADGSLATIQYLAHGTSALPKERGEAAASRATAVLDNFARTDFHGVKRSPVKGPQNKGFAGELDAFFEAVKNGGSWPIPFESLVGTTRVTFAAVEALRSGRAVSLDAMEEDQRGSEHGV